MQNLLPTLGSTREVDIEATSAKSGATEKMTGLPVFFDDLQAEIHFIVIQNDPHDVIAAFPSTKRLWGVLELPAEVTDENHCGQTAVLSTMPEYMRPCDRLKATERDDFKFKLEERHSAPSQDKNSDGVDLEKLFLTLRDDVMPVAKTIAKMN